VRFCDDKVETNRPRVHRTDLRSARKDAVIQLLAVDAGLPNLAPSKVCGEAFDVHFKDGRVVNQAVDGGDGHGGIRKIFPLPQGWLAVISSEDSNHRTTAAGNSDASHPFAVRDRLSDPLLALVRGWIAPPDLSLVSPRYGMASLAGLSSHHRPCTRCGRTALPIVLIGAIHPPLWAATIGLWPVDDFQRIARGRHRDGSCRHSRILRATHSSYKAICIARPPRKSLNN
jgi:hypothetical protein